MADTKISALAALAAADVDVAADVLPIVDTSVTTTKKILVSELSLAMHKNGTSQATTSGSSIDFTSIPAWATEIKVMLVGVSADGNFIILVRIGDSGGLATTGYSYGYFNSTATSTNTTGFSIENQSSLYASHGCLTLSLVNAATFTWACTMNVYNGTTAIAGAGTKSLSGALDRLSLVVLGGASFDAGLVNISYR